MDLPTEVPGASGAVTTGGPVLVLDDGDGAELCLGGVDDSFPPQCGGPELVGWDWADHAGDFEDHSGTRWGEFVVTGTFDGTSMTPAEVVPAVEHDGPAAQEEDVWTTPCPEPDGGWVPLDPATTTQRAFAQAQRVADGLPDLSAFWVDQSINPLADDEPGGLEWEQGMNDPHYLIVNVAVTDDVAAAETAIREVWGGPLCVSEAPYTDRELGRVQDAMRDLPGMLGSSSDLRGVHVSVTFDDGSIQAWVDQEHGEGVVQVSSALAPVED